MLSIQSDNKPTLSPITRNTPQTDERGGDDYNRFRKEKKGMCNKKSLTEYDYKNLVGDINIVRFSLIEMMRMLEQITRRLEKTIEVANYGDRILLSIRTEEEQSVPPQTTQKCIFYTVWQSIKASVLGSG
jgi:hypothetical protein